MHQAQEILQKWNDRSRRFRPRMELTSDGLVLGAGTILATTARGGRDASTLTFDEPRVLALLTTAYEKPVGPRGLAKVRHACELWNAGEKALAHILLAHSGLPPCNQDRALRLFARDELLKSGVTPEAPLRAQGLDPAPLALLKYSPDQPRVPAGNGRESGRWTTEGAAGPGTSDAAASEDDRTGRTENVVEERSSSNITVASPAPAEVAQNVTCSAFIEENCKGMVLRAFPSEYLDVTVDQLLKDAQAGVPAAKKAKKHLFDRRFGK